MTLERSAVIMDEIFASPEEEGRGRLLKIIQDFLVSEAAKHIAKEKGTVSSMFRVSVVQAKLQSLRRANRRQAK